MTDSPAAGNAAGSVPSDALTSAAEGIAIELRKVPWISAAPERIRALAFDCAARALEVAGELIIADAVSGMAEATRAHRAEQDAVHADLSQMLRVLGMGDHARPQSSHEVMLDAISEVGRIRLALERAEVLVAERDRQWAEALRENERLRRAVADRNADIGWLGGMPDD